jgi:2-oxoglutarate-Fe(II)-dependent dioxygenase family protein
VPLDRIWEELSKQDHAVAGDAELGLGPEVRPHILRTYFTARILENDHPAVHRDRDRARDVIRYRWSGDRLHLREHDVTEIRDRSGVPGPRAHARVLVLSDPVMTEWVRTVLALIPPHLRQDEGTFGVNFLRTRTTVVSGPHHDQEEYVVVYVADKRGSGAETTLHSVDDPAKIVHRVTLAPGQMIVFRDAAFLHDASPLIGAAGRPAQRDAVVCTVNYRDTYDLGER